MAAARMQCWGIFLSAYQYDVEYKRSKEHSNADGLSRLPLGEDTEEEDTAQLFHVSFVDALPITAEEIAVETSKDKQLSRVYCYVMEGWPGKELPDALKPFYNKREELSTDQGCLLWGMRVIIPTSLQRRVLNELHFTHPGIIKMKLLARSYVWWPKLDSNIEDLVRSCSDCAALHSLPPKAPLHSWPWANHPMQRLHIDYAEIEGLQVLVIIDVHSKWIEAVPMHSATADTTINALHKFFSSFGLPEEIVSDNGTQFTAHQFQTFCERNGIKHSKTPPYHPASNGAAERAVAVVKHAVQKMGTTIPLNIRIARFLLVYHTTPHATTEMRPDELFLRRRLRSRLTLTQPCLSARVEKHQLQQKHTHDSLRPLRTFTIEAPVWVRNQRGLKQWVPGKIVRQKGPVTYLVQVGGKVRFCHVDHLLTRRLASTIKLNENNSASRPALPDGNVAEPLRPSSLAPAVPARQSIRLRLPTKHWIEEI